MERIVIVVEDGRVIEVYCTDARFSADIIDVDTDDCESEEEIKKSLEELKKDTENGILTLI